MLSKLNYHIKTLNHNTIMKKIRGKHGGTLYAREKGDPSPRKGQVKNTAQTIARKPAIRHQHKG